MQTRDITLPCGTAATIQPFDGAAQLLLKNAIADVVAPQGGETGEKAVARGSWEDRVLGRVIRTLDGKPKAGDGSDVKRLPVGSRHRAMIEARRMAYGDVVKCRVACVHCQRMNSLEVDLSKVGDVPYPAARKYELTVKDPHTEVEYTFTLHRDTGIDEQAFTHALKTRALSFDDAVLCAIEGVRFDDGNGDSHDGQLSRRLLLERIPVSVLDELRTAYSYMIPILAIEGEPEIPEEYAGAAAQAAGACVRIQTRCEHCDETFRFLVTEQPDFLLRGIVKS